MGALFLLYFVIPATAGIQRLFALDPLKLDTRRCGYDGWGNESNYRLTNNCRVAGVQLRCRAV
jgi:hypothetical protein